MPRSRILQPKQLALAGTGLHTIRTRINIRINLPKLMNPAPFMDANKSPHPGCGGEREANMGGGTLASPLANGIGGGGGGGMWWRWTI